jgi:hypothetical protein
VTSSFGSPTTSGTGQQNDPFYDTRTGDEASDFPLETYKKAAGVAYEFSKKKLEDTRAQQEALNAQRQKFSESDEARDYQQAQQAYKY